MPTKKIYTNTIAQIAGKLATVLISIFMIKILTGYLDVAGYGIYSKIYNYLSIFAVIADMGLYTITVRELSKYEHDQAQWEKIAGNTLSLRTISGIVIIGASLAIAPFLSGYNSREAIVAIAIVGVFTLFGLINSSLMSSLQAMLKTEFSFIANTAGKALTFVLIFCVASIWLPFFPDISREMKLWITLLAGLLGNILMTGLTWWYTKKFQKIYFAWDTSYIWNLIKISFPYGVALFLGVIFFKVDLILLSILEPVEVADTAIALYALPMKIVDVGMVYGIVFLNSLLPVLTAAIEKKDMTTTKKLTKKGFELLMGCGSAIAVFCLCFAPEIIRLISTEKFISTTLGGYSSVQVLQIVAWIFLFYFISSLSNYILIAKGEQKKILYINASVALINIIGNIIFIPMYSFIGSAWVTLVTQGVLVIITWYLVRENYDNRHQMFQGICFIVWAFLCGFCALECMQSFSFESLNSIWYQFLRMSIGGCIFSFLYFGGWFALQYFIRKRQQPRY